MLLFPPAPVRLTHEQAGAYLDACVAVLNRAGLSNEWVAQLDASALEDFDSSALAALLAVRRRVVSKGGELQVLGLPPRLRDLAALYGVSALLPA